MHFKKKSPLTDPPKVTANVHCPLMYTNRGLTVSPPAMYIDSFLGFSRVNLSINEMFFEMALLYRRQSR